MLEYVIFGREHAPDLAKALLLKPSVSKRLPSSRRKNWSPPFARMKSISGS